MNSENKINLNIELMFHSYLGENVLVCGNTKELGEWDVRRAFPLNYKHVTSTPYPTHLQSSAWVGKIELPRVKGTVEYKYVIHDENFDTFTWEDGENRKLELTTENLAIDEINKSKNFNLS